MWTHGQLATAIVPPGTGADFVAAREGSLARVRPLCEPARQWLRSQVTGEVSWLGEDLVVELRFFPALADAILEAGFRFEGNAWAQSCQ